MSRSFLFLIAAVVVVAFAGPAHANDLLRLYKLAVRRDSTLQADQAQRDAAVEARPQALAQWLPHLAGTAQPERQFEDEELPAIRATANETTFGLTVSQTLWSYTDYSQLKEADAEAASAEATYLAAEQQEIVTVADDYFAVLAAQDQLTTLRRERDAFGVLLQHSRDQEHTGVGPASAVVQDKMFYDQAVQFVISARTALDEAKFALEVVVGEPPGHIASLREEIPLTAPDPASAHAWVAMALLNNPNVRAAQLTAVAGKRNIGVQRGQGLPTLSLEGAGTRTVAPVVLAGNTKLATIGVYFHWPLFQGGEVASEVRQARALYRADTANLTTQKRETARQTRNAYLNIVNGIEGITAARRAMEAASAAVVAARRNIQFFGSQFEFELLQYEGIYYQAIVNYDVARYQYLENVLVLKQQAGSLTEHDLAAMDALLATGGTGN
jgi:outer membrane protein